MHSFIKKPHLSLLFFFALLSANTNQCLNIIFALDELLFTVDKKTLNDILGHDNFSTKIGFWWHGGYTSKAALVKDVMAKLQSIPAHTQISVQDQAFYTGQKVAPILCEWILGLRHCTEIQATIIDHLLHNHSIDPWVKNKLLEMINLGLDPQKFIQIVQTVPEGFDLLQRCYNTRRHNLYILSNCPSEIIDALHTKFPELFALFSGQAISSKIHLIKPHLPIYHYLMKEYNLSPQDCLYIGTTEDALQTAKRLGMNTILWDPYNYAPGLEALKAQKILD
jgi:FMN phosphatase YigB (HAD superfamily)